eukprot:UN34847
MSLVNSITVDCVYRDQGCSEKVRIVSRQEHHETCEWEDMNCKNFEHGCVNVFLRKDLKKHICPFDLIECDYCKEKSLDAILNVINMNVQRLLCYVKLWNMDVRQNIDEKKTKNIKNIVLMLKLRVWFLKIKDYEQKIEN